MARLEAQSKLLYYPTPPSVVETIATWFRATGPTRLVDPCCGKGEALAQFAKLVCPEAETWGIEISYSRAVQAKRVLTTVLSASFYEMRPPSRWSNASVSLAFTNPPYDWSSHEENRNGQKRKVRHEVLFLEGVTPKIVPGGHHILILPRTILGDKMLLGEGQEGRVARHLFGWYEDVKLYRFPDGEYERFKQVVVLACNKRQKYQPPKKEFIDALTVFADENKPMVVLPEGAGQYLIPPTPDGKANFIHTPYDPGQLLELGRECSPINTPAYERATYVRPIGAAFTPAMPLSLGHITMLIAGQETGVLTLKTEEGKDILVKGMSRKVVDVQTNDRVNEKGEYSHTTVNEREKHIATITIAHQDGNLEMLQSSSNVGEFITQFADPIADAILKRNEPLYDLKPSLPEWGVTSGAAKGLPALPNRKERGLFEVQRHFSIAAARIMKRHRHAIMNCEMGFGKTATSIASLELMDKWPVLIMCPGHMVFKWRRDLERASNPDNPIAARVITRPVLSEPPTWVSGLRPSLEEAGGIILDTTRRQVNPVTPNDPGGRRKVVIGCDAGNRERILAKVQKLAFKDRAAKKVIKPDIQTTPGCITVEFVDRDEYTMFDFYKDFEAGLLGERAAAVIAFDPAKYDAGAEKEPAFSNCWRKVYNDRSGEYKLRKVPICPTCGEEVEPKSRFCEQCQSPLFNFTRWRRVGLSRLVQHKFKHFFKVYIADEVHKTQAGRTDIGTADQRFLSSIKYSLALTGTLFGGTAGSLFFLLYRRVPELRRLYEFKEKNRFIDHYGVWERTWDQGKPYFDGQYGASTGIKRWNYRQRELPGVAPAVIRFLLPITLFGNITDLGYELPPLYENVEQLAMTSVLARQYALLEDGLLKKALELVRNGDVGALSAWFTAVRFRPASAFRNEQVNYVSKRGAGEIHWNLVPVISASEPWLPKEVKLAEIVRQNMQKDRKTLTFVEQTGTRDIRDRLKKVIEQLAPGSSMTLVEVPKVGVLSAADMSPAKRESWIKLQAPSMNAMLVNPKLVETGLDLVMFSDLIFYEITTSLYTLWQAMRRVWRLGQNRDVNVTFLSYANTMESEILRRMGLKMKYAQLLYGKEAAGVLIEADADDIQREIINAALEGKAFRNAGEAVEKLSIFSTGQERSLQVTTSPTGSPIATSPVIVPAIDLPSGKVYQLTLLPGFEPVPVEQLMKRRRRR
jgi:hypothetical protein